jgi:DNA-binding transcriptional regulator YdaS (Cro superfamily)
MEQSFSSLLKSTRGLTARELAKQLGVTPQAVSQWRRVPAERVIDVERLTEIPRHTLRPDIYPPSDAEGED